MYKSQDDMHRRYKKSYAVLKVDDLCAAFLAMLTVLYIQDVRPNKISTRRKCCMFTDFARNSHSMQAGYSDR
jgi:hypothetical protein